MKSQVRFVLGAVSAAGAAAALLRAQGPACSVEVVLADPHARPAVVRVTNHGPAAIVAAMVGAQVENAGRSSASWEMADSVLTGATERDLAPGESRAFSFRLQFDASAVHRFGFIDASGAGCGEPELAAALRKRREAVRAELPATLQKIRGLREARATKEQIRAAFTASRSVTAWTVEDGAAAARRAMEAASLAGPAAMDSYVLSQINLLDRTPPGSPPLSAEELLNRLEQFLASVQSRLGG